MIVSKRRHLLKDVQAIRHVDIDNDHNLVIAKICIKMGFNVTELKDPGVREKLNIKGTAHPKSKQLSLSINSIRP